MHSIGMQLQADIGSRLVGNAARQKLAGWRSQLDHEGMPRGWVAGPTANESGPRVINACINLSLRRGASIPVLRFCP